MKCPNTVPYRGKITSDKRRQLLGQQNMVLWFTGLSGSGKSTLAHAVEERLYELGRLTYVFDGDNVRQGLCSDLSFSPEGRQENLRRIAEMVKLFLDAGIICLTAFISPLRDDRQHCRELIDCGRFFEIYVKCSLEECERRDVKGLYQMAREGKIKNYTGVSAPYEAPEQPDLTLETDRHTLEECVNQVVEFATDVAAQKSR
ncbi:MAG: adenylyl-sulfate kinase [Desulfurivibrio sp.]|nr:adenylyl-sulfate kinase [Desulfurivibrio sp.]